jgi:DNA-binding Lrp family transcriptional regulator
MAILDEQISAGDHAAVGGLEHRRVITDAHQRARGRRETRGQCRDEPEFAQIRDGDGALPAAVFGFRVAWRSPAEGNEAPRGGRMVQAYILVQTEVGKAAEVARRIGGIKGVTLAEDVTGPYDVIVRAEAENVDDLGKLVVAQIQGVSGITRTLTCPIVHI